MATRICVFNTVATPAAPAIPLQTGSNLIDMVTAVDGALVPSPGPSAAGVPVVLNPSGLIDPSLTHSGSIATADSGGVNTGNLVTLYIPTSGPYIGLVTMQPATASPAGTGEVAPPPPDGYPAPAVGFVTQLYNPGALGTVNFAGTFNYNDPISEFSATSIGLQVWLADSGDGQHSIGAITLTPPSGSGTLKQPVGMVTDYNSGIVTVNFVPSFPNTGTVFHVGMTVPTWLSVTPASITTTGTFAIAVAGASTGYVLTATSATSASWQAPSGGGGAPGSPSLSIQGNNGGMFAGVVGSVIDFTNGLISLAPTGTGVALTVTGDASGLDIVDFVANGAYTVLSISQPSNAGNAAAATLTGDGVLNALSVYDSTLSGLPVFYILPANGNLYAPSAFGQGPPGAGNDYQLAVSASPTSDAFAPTTEWSNFVSSLGINVTGSSSNGWTGVFSTVSVSGSATYTDEPIYGDYTSLLAGTTGDLISLVGGHFNASQVGSGSTCSILIGAEVQTSVGDSAPSAATAVYGVAITTSMAATCTADNMAGLHVFGSNTNIAGTVIHNYGIYIEDQSTPAGGGAIYDPWAIYSPSNSHTQFGPLDSTFDVNVYPDNASANGIYRFASQNQAQALAFAVITSVQIISNVVTLTSANTLVVGQQVQIYGMTTATFLNGAVLTITSATGSAFVAGFVHANYGPTAEGGAFALSATYANTLSVLSQEDPSISLSYNLSASNFAMDITTASDFNLPIFSAPIVFPGGVTGQYLATSHEGNGRIYGSSAVSSVQITTNVLTITFQSFGGPQRGILPGTTVKFSGFVGASFLNGLTATVLTSTSSAFTASFTHADYGPTSDTSAVVLGGTNYGIIGAIASANIQQTTGGMDLLAGQIIDTGNQGHVNAIFGTYYCQMGDDPGFADNVFAIFISPQKNGGGGSRPNETSVWGIYEASPIELNALGQIHIGGSAGPLLSSGSATPEGAITSIQGGYYFRTNGLIYAKVSGSGNTGWSPVNPGIRTATTTDSASNDDGTILCNGTFTETLPTTGIYPRKKFVIKNIGTGVITVSSSANIDGSTSLMLNTQYQSVTVEWDGTQYWIE